MTIYSKYNALIQIFLILTCKTKFSSDWIGICPLLPRFRADFCQGLGRLQNRHPPPPNMARSVEPLRPHSWHVDRCLNPSPKMQSCKSKEAGPNLSCWKWWSGSRLTQICHSHENPPCTATTLMSFHFLCLENSSETLRLSANTRGNKTSEIHISIEQRALHKHTCGFLRLLKTQMSRGRTLL